MMTVVIGCYIFYHIYIYSNIIAVKQIYSYTSLAFETKGEISGVVKSTAAHLANHNSALHVDMLVA